MALFICRQPPCSQIFNPLTPFQNSVPRNSHVLLLKLTKCLKTHTYSSELLSKLTDWLNIHNSCDRSILRSLRAFLNNVGNTSLSAQVLLEPNKGADILKSILYNAINHIQVNKIVLEILNPCFQNWTVQQVLSWMYLFLFSLRCSLNKQPNKMKKKWKFNQAASKKSSIIYRVYVTIPNAMEIILQRWETWHDKSDPPKSRQGPPSHPELNYPRKHVKSNRTSE